jgi:hypothetical protein
MIFIKREDIINSMAEYFSFEKACKNVLVFKKIKNLGKFILFDCIRFQHFRNRLMTMLLGHSIQREAYTNCSMEPVLFHLPL